MGASSLDIIDRYPAFLVAKSDELTFFLVRRSSAICSYVVGFCSFLPS